MSFELAIRAEFATLHLMHENNLTDKPVDLCLGMGYDLKIKDSKKWSAIQTLYKNEIDQCLLKGVVNRRGFKYKELPEGEPC